MKKVQLLSNEELLGFYNYANSKKLFLMGSKNDEALKEMELLTPSVLLLEEEIRLRISKLGEEASNGHFGAQPLYRPNWLTDIPELTKKEILSIVEVSDNQEILSEEE